MSRIECYVEALPRGLSADKRRDFDVVDAVTCPVLVTRSSGASDTFFWCW